MEYTAADESPVRKKITIKATPGEVNAALDALVDRYRREARFDGFRQGKAPRDMVEKTFREKIYGEAAQSLYEKQTVEALKELDLKPISHIRLENGEIKRGEPYEYAVSFDVMPEVTLPAYEGMRVEQEEVSVAPAEVDAFIERIQNNLATQKPIEEKRPPKAGEAAIIDFQTFDENGKPIPSMQARDFLFLVGRTEELADVDALVRTLAPGEEGNAKVAFPERFPNADVAGRTLPMTVKVVSIHEHLKPGLDDALAKRASGHETMEKMREAIEKSFLDRRTHTARQNAMVRMMDTLMAEADFPLPEALVEEQAIAYLNDLGERLARAGKSPKELGKTFDELKAEAEDKARKAVKSQILLTKIGEKEGIEATDEEVEQQIRALAERTGQAPQAMRAQCEKDGSLDIIRHNLRTDKIVEAIYNKANVVTIAPRADAEGAEGKGEAAD